MLVIFDGAWVTKLLYTYLTKVTHVTKIFIFIFLTKIFFFLLRNKVKLNKKNKLNLSFLVTNCTLISIYMVSLFTPLMLILSYMNIDIFFKDEYWLYYMCVCVIIINIL